MAAPLAGNIFNWNNGGANGGLIRTVDDFYKGGECVRGFAPAGLGPRDQLAGDALGGKNFYCATAEVRFPIPFIPEDMGFGGAIFADAGSVWGTDAYALADAYLKKSGLVDGCASSGAPLAKSMIPLRSVHRLVRA